MATFVLLVALFGMPSAAAQAEPRASQVIPPAKPVPAFADLQNWIQLSKTHQVGRLDDAVRTLATWRRDQIQSVDRDLLVLQLLLDPSHPDDAGVRTAGRTLVIKDLSALFDLPNSLFMKRGELLTPRESEPLTPREIRKPDSAPRQAIAKILMRAAMLHTDLLTSSSRDDLLRSSTGLPPGTTIRVDDAESKSVVDLGLYWSCARTAMDLAAPTPPNGTLVRDWYLATAEYLLTERDYAAGVPHLEHARSVLSGEARIALYLGAAYENLAAPPIQAAYQNGASALVIGSRPTLLRKAEFQLRSALLLEPDTTDASLRLGRTLLLMARPSEALPLLARAEAASLREPLKYYAALFSGFAHAELGHATDARAAFARASALFPDAQSPRLGVAQLAMLAANRDEALTSIQTITTGKPDSDPWWTYDRDLAWNVSDRMMVVRIGVLERLK